MEFRMVHIRKVYTIGDHSREWRIINPLSFGIRISESSIPKESKRFFNMQVQADIIAFLIKIAGEGGPWEGWTMHALGNLRETSEIIDPTPFFEVVFARKELPASDGVHSLLDETKPPKHEDFPALDMAEKPLINGNKSDRV